MNYRQNIWLAVPLIAAFVLLVLALVLMVTDPAAAVAIEVFPPPLPLDELPPTGHDTVVVAGFEIPYQFALAAAVLILMAALAMIPRARRALAEERAKREADRG